MKPTRKIIFPTVLLLLVMLLAWAQAEDKKELLIDSSRNAVLKITSGGPSDGLTGNVDAQADFAKGQGALKGDLKLPPDTVKEMGEANGAAYLNMAAAVFEAIGSVEANLPPKPDMPKKLDINVDSVFNDRNSYARGTLAVEAPANGKVPKVSINGNGDASAAAANGKLNFTVDLAENAKQVPFKNFQLTISEKDTSTTIALNLAVDGKSPAAAQFRQIGKNPDQIKQGITQGLGQAKITVEKVEMAEFKDTPDLVSGGVTIVLKDWRGTVNNQIGAMSQGDENGKKMSEAAKKLLETKIDNFDFKLAMDANNLKGDIDTKISNTQSLMIGYADLVSAILAETAKSQGDESNPGVQFQAALNKFQAEEMKKVAQAMFDSGAKMTLSGNLEVDSTGGNDKTPGPASVKVDGKLDLGVDNWKAYCEKAEALGLPVGKTTEALIDFKLAEGGKLTGKIYAYTDGKIGEYYKTLILNVLKDIKGAEKAADVIKGIEFKGAQAAFSLGKDGTITMAGHGESSDLSPVVDAIMAEAAKQGNKLEMKPLGGSVTAKFADNKGTADISAFFSNFMPGKSADDVKEEFEGFTVNDKASADQTKLVAVTAPEVKMPDSLVAIQKEAQAKLAVAAAIPGGSKGGNTLPIIGGIAVLVLLGVGVAAGRGKK